MKFKSPVYHVVAVPIDKIVPNTYFCLWGADSGGLCQFAHQ